MDIKLSLNQFIIPRNPLIKSNESWDEYVNISYKNNSFCLDRFTKRYYSKDIKDILNTICLSIESKITTENLQDKIKLELLHETSCSGLPHQLHLAYYEKNEQINLLFDGFIFLVYINKEIDFSSSYSIHKIVELTNSALSFRNETFRIIQDIFELNICGFHNPFWAIETPQLNSLFNMNYKNADYPVFRMICNDKNFATHTNYGDKQVNKIGRSYEVYFSEDVTKIREKICHDMILEHELENFKQFLNFNSDNTISANTKLIQSLKIVPSGIHHFFGRHKLWLSLKGVSSELLSIDIMLPKYKKCLQIISERVKRGTSYINAQQSIPLIEDKKYCHQREVESFFQITYDEDSDRGFTLNSKKSSTPPYSYLTKELKKELKNLDKNLNNALETLNKTVSLYSTNFGFDAICIAIITLIVTLISLLITA